MMSCGAADLTSQDAVVRLYAHETSRVYCDKLTSEKEREKFCGFQVDSMQKYFKVCAGCIFHRLILKLSFYLELHFKP